MIDILWKGRRMHGIQMGALKTELIALKCHFPSSKYFVQDVEVTPRTMEIKGELGASELSVL